ncbi:hypothetical protein FQA47_014186 [Oryzias melastigma]|uniref:Uncharacterized protein n=1 Tax=Oryzias melastigma TaxID=30732 RepID=A0A834L068_ORYME|nr:hypothetical protein FQA47_014186 [Oryzias melastigma]
MQVKVEELWRDTLKRGGDGLWGLSETPHPPPLWICPSKPCLELHDNQTGGAPSGLRPPCTGLGGSAPAEVNEALLNGGFVCVCCVCAARRCSTSGRSCSASTARLNEWRSEEISCSCTEIHSGSCSLKGRGGAAAAPTRVPRQTGASNRFSHRQPAVVC